MCCTICNSIIYLIKSKAMEDKIDRLIKFYKKENQNIVEWINGKNDIDADRLISYGEELKKNSIKISALEMAK